MSAVEDEAPKLTFGQYAIAFHVAARWCGHGEPPIGSGTQLERAMKSYEDDMLLYAHRYRPPFSTRVIQPAEELREVLVGFASNLEYESEGRCKRVRCAGAAEHGRVRKFGLALGQTWFGQSHLSILSLVLRPMEWGSEDSELNEYDVIKLVKLWEGGEGIEGASTSVVEGQHVWFATTPNEKATLHELVVHAFPRGWQPLGYEYAGCERKSTTTARSAYRVGTVELQLPPSKWRRQLFHDIATLKTRRERPKSESDWDRVVAVGGILQGLLDFRQIEDYELADVFAEVDINPDDETMRAFHKGTLLSFAAEDEEKEEDDNDESQDRPPAPMGVDPYLAVPNIVLLHDEQRLRAARLLEFDISFRQGGRLRDFRNRAAISETEDNLSQMAEYLAQQHPNVFHYLSEQQLQKQGRQSRGLEDLETFIRHRMDDLSSVLQSRVRRRDRWTAVLGIAVSVITAFLLQQAIAGKPVWIVIVALLLFGVFLWLRNRLF